MTIDKKVTYSGKVDTTDPSNYKYGKAQNITTIGDDTGTPWEADGINDRFGFEEALLENAQITPNGNPDTLGDSQLYQAVQETASGRAIGFKVNPGSTATSLILEPLQTYQQGPVKLFEGMIVRFKKNLQLFLTATCHIQGTSQYIPINNSVDANYSTNLLGTDEVITELQLVDFGLGTERWEVINNGLPYLLTSYRADIPEWGATETYNVPDPVYYNKGFYYSLINGNTGNNPAANPAQWQKQNTDMIENVSDLPGTDITSALNSIPVFRTGTFTSTTDGDQIVNFSTPFPNNCYHVSLTLIEPNKDNIFSLNGAPSTTGFIVNRPDDASGTFDHTYFAIGD